MADTVYKATDFISLPAGEQEILRAHLITCPTCRAALQQVTIEELTGMVMRCLSLTGQ